MVKKPDVKLTYEDDSLFVFDKPAGLTVTSEGRGGLEDTFEKWLSRNYLLLNGIKRNGIVHRIDKNTSGLVLVAKNMKIYEALQGLFKSRQIKKTYTALVWGDLPQEGEINLPIGRRNGAFGKWGVKVGGKKARTGFRLIKKYNYFGRVISLVNIDLFTGRTHQIRVHFSSMGWSLVGDKTYGGKYIFGLERPFLHASKIGFIHPVYGKSINLSSRLRDDLENILDQLGKNEI